MCSYYQKSNKLNKMFQWLRWTDIRSKLVSTFKKCIELYHIEILIIIFFLLYSKIINLDVNIFVLFPISNIVQRR